MVMSGASLPSTFLMGQQSREAMAVNATGISKRQSVSEIYFNIEKRIDRYLHSKCRHLQRPIVHSWGKKNNNKLLTMFLKGKFHEN